MKLSIYFFILFSFFSCKNKDNTSTKKGVMFEWNFDGEKKYQYTYFRNTVFNFEQTQIEQSRNALGFDEGKIIIEPNGNSFADLSLKNVNVIIDGDIEKDTLTDSTTNYYIRNINENGGGFSSDSVDFVYKLLLLLPSKPIEIGEKEQLELKIPFTYNGDIYYTKGTYTITYLKNGKLNDTKCAILIGSLDVSNIEFEVALMEAIEDGLEVKFIGEVKQYFDTKNNLLLGADIKINHIYNTNKYSFMNMETIMNARID